MSYKTSLWTGLLGLSATIALVQPNIAAAASAVEIGAIAKSITVQIVGENNSGSGVILQRQGDTYTVLTAAHVLDKSINYKIVTPDNRSYQIVPNSIRIASGGIDLAVVKFKSTTKYVTAKLGNCNALKLGMDLYVAGFPNKREVIAGSELAFTPGQVTTNSSKNLDKGYSLIYSNPTQEGMSGGAVLNGNGELVAIHGMGDREELDDGKFGGKTGFNFGIPINRFAMVASNMGVQLGGQVTPIPRSTVGKPDDYFVSGILKHRKGNIQGALVDFNQAISLDPKYALAYGNRAILKYENLNDVQGALADYDRAIAFNPKYAKAYANRGKLKDDKLNDFQGALADYDRAISLNPKLDYAYLYRAILKDYKFNDFQGALADWNQIIAFYPKSADGYNNRGYLKAYKLNDLQGALADFNRAIALNPKSADGYNNRGSLKGYKLKDFQGALADYERAIALNLKDADIYHNRGKLKNDNLNDVPGALADYDRAIVLNPKDAKIYYNRATLKADKLNDFQGALADYNQAIILDPQDFYAYHSRGNLKYQKLNDFQGAVADYDRAIVLDRKSVAAYTNRGNLKKYKLNDEQGALADFQQVEALSRQQGLNAK
jgi:tetratricopeptide (TPR) repeat protein